MYVVTKGGHKLPVDDSSIDYDKEVFFPFQQQVGLYDDNTILKPIWLVTGQKDTRSSHLEMTSEYEFVADKKYYHEPTKEEILWFMSANGLRRYDIVTIEKGYELDIE